MTDAVAALSAPLASSPLAARFERFRDPFTARRSKDAALREVVASPIAPGLARLLASHADPARYLAIRPQLLERIAHASPDALEQRLVELEHLPRPQATDLQEFLNALRLFRKDETYLCAALDLGGLIPFERAAVYLSAIAETCLRWALSEARTQLAGNDARSLAIVGMGKISGRELTYHSDLDLVFLYSDPELPPPQPVALAQRVISYLGTMTETGTAYAVDSRLRPSGRQGTLVSLLSAFESYQRGKAARWEHLALMRARVLVGDEHAVRVLGEVRRGLAGSGGALWSEVAQMRERVEIERGAERPGGAPYGSVPYKTGWGGLMDVEFLAQAGALERGLPPGADRLPSIDALLRGLDEGPAVECLLVHYRFLRCLEARVRWVNGRASERFPESGENAECAAELIHPGSSLEAVLAQLARARAEIREIYTRVLQRGSIAGLSG